MISAFVELTNGTTKFELGSLSNACFLLIGESEPADLGFGFGFKIQRS